MYNKSITKLSDKVKCAQKEIKTKLKTDEDFRKLFTKYVMIGLDNLICKTTEVEESDDSIDLTSNILNMYPGSNINSRLSA